MKEITYRCTVCNEIIKTNDVIYLCPKCSKDYVPGQPLKGILFVEYNYDYLKKEFSKTFDIKLFNPIDLKYFPNIKVGHTPFYKSEQLSNYYGLNIFVKNDTLNPSGSLKDRASYLMVAEANRLGIDEIVTASTGNAASALACIAASANKKAVIMVPESAPEAKLVQILQFGAKLIKIKGTYDDAFKISLEYSKIKNVLNRNTAYHPFTIEGKKTVGLEIYIQNFQKAPDVILIPVGDGVILSGVYKAFYDLKQAGIIHKMPKLVAVQAEKSAAIHNYFTSNEYKKFENPDTIADSISVSIPSAAYLAYKALKETDGFSVIVSDQQILEAQLFLSQKTGLFVEPSSATVVAALNLLKNNNLVQPNEQIILLLTGTGLKDLKTATKLLTFSLKSYSSINEIVEDNNET